MTFQEQFFGPGNKLRWDAIKGGTLPPDVRQRLGPFLQHLESKVELLILPRVFEDGRVRWYVLCSDAHVARIAKDELLAFLGPSYSDFEGQPARLSVNDPIDVAVHNHFGRNVFTLEVSDRRLFDSARARLLLLINVRKLRPTRHAVLFRPVGRVLRDFEYALLARDFDGASECIEELRSTGRLTTSNLLFLKIRTFAALEKWGDILALPELASILVIARPRRVTEDLIRAVYICELRQFEQESRTNDAVTHFRTKVYPRFSDLYSSRAGLTGFEVDVSFALASIAIPTRYSNIEAPLTSYPAASRENSYLRGIAALRPSRNGSRDLSSPLQQAQSAFSAADIDKAFALALPLSPSFERTAILLRCAREMGTLSAAAISLESLDTLTPASRTRIRDNAFLNRILDELGAIRATPSRVEPPKSTREVSEVPKCWPEWLRRLTDQEPWRGALNVAEAASREWSLADYLADPGLLEEVGDLLLASRHSWGQIALRDSIPYLLQFFLSGEPDTRLRAVYDNLFLQVATDDQSSVSQTVALATLAETIIALGVDAPRYRDILHQLTRAIESIDSPLIAGPALEIVDSLIILPCADSSARQAILLRVASLFLQHYRRIGRARWLLLQRYAQELQLPEVVTLPPAVPEEEESQNPWIQLESKTIGLYSLRENVLNRTESTLKALAPGISIQSFHDLVGGSPALRHSAANADIFVIATAAAKHAATEFILAHRPKSRTTLYARSQGSAGLLHALTVHLSSEASGRPTTL